MQGHRDAELSKHDRQTGGTLGGGVMRCSFYFIESNTETADLRRQETGVRMSEVKVALHQRKRQDKLGKTVTVRRVPLLSQCFFCNPSISENSPTTAREFFF